MAIKSRKTKCIHTGIWQRLIAAFATLFIISNSFPVFAVNKDTFPQEDSGMPVSDEAPLFTARIEWTPNGYVAKGTFTEFPSDISLVQPLYSLDGETWEVCEVDWDLQWLEIEGAGALEKLQNQVCLYQSHEPLSSYLAGELDRFSLKLRLVRENGFSYETQTATIDRGDVQEIPAGMNLSATFSPAMLIRETNPFRYYGRYQLTVSEDATPEDISAYLPDTLPIRITLQSGIDFVTSGTVDCPVTWKPLSLPQLIAGESITVLDAAEEIVIPGGTLLRTPLGVFRLNESMGINQYSLTDEVRLVLNVIKKDESPTGVLAAENNGLEIAFHLKPTGATAIRAYVLSQGESEWTELSASSLLEAVNAQPSTANSGYAFVLSSSEEPYRSYLTAKSTQSVVTPFLICLKIEGGVYDGQQLILTWPDTYEHPVYLPILGGAGGNEGNAGAGNSGDSTAEGQRPNLPQEPEDKTKLPALPDTSSINKSVSKTPFTGNTVSAAPVSPNTGEDVNPPRETGSNTAVNGLFLLAAAVICIVLAACKILAGIISRRANK